MGRAAFLGRLSEYLSALLICTIGMVTPASAQDMPKDFVYLRDVDPTIQQGMRYAGRRQLHRSRVPGYGAPECARGQASRRSPKAVEADLGGQGLGLKVYDCYRPAQAVADFVDWAKERTIPLQGRALPALSKRRVSGGLYRHVLRPFARRHHGPHSRSARRPISPAQRLMDAALGHARRRKPSGKPIRASTWAPALIGFDVKANTHASGLTPEQRANRHAMSRRGFKNYRQGVVALHAQRRALPNDDLRFPD